MLQRALRLREEDPLGTSLVAEGCPLRALDASITGVILNGMKTAISMPDDVFAEAEEAAKRLGVSRSELVTRAVRAFLETRSAANITRSYDEAFADAPSDTDAFSRRATRRALLDVEWDEK